MKERDLKKGKKKKRYITIKQLVREIDNLINLCKAQGKSSTVHTKARAAVPKGKGIVTTFQGRKTDDGRWVREVHTPILTDRPLFWATYEKLTGRDRRFWLDKVLELDPDTFVSLITQVDDLWAMWSAFREWLRWNSSQLKGQQHFFWIADSAWNLKPGHRPFQWWFGAIHNFVKIDKKGDIHLLRPPVEDQPAWLRKHKYLSPAEERVLKERKKDPEHPHDLTGEEELEALDYGIELNE